MKISEFAIMNHVTTKMLRHYDEIGLLKPSVVDSTTGYRSYDAGQSPYLNWIIILKNLDFSLTEIKNLLSGPIDSGKLVAELTRKKIEIASQLNVQIQKKIEIDTLIRLLEKEGFKMEKQINLLDFRQETVHEIKKNIPNMEMFLDSAKNIAALCSDVEPVAVFRFDISHFKQVNDNYGFEVGDKVIVACYNMISDNIAGHLQQSTLGRAHGDEFIVFAKGGKEEVQKAAEAIIAAMQTFDFSVLGCMEQKGCYIGGLVGLGKSAADIRSMIEGTIDTIDQARKYGTNSVQINTFEG